MSIVRWWEYRLSNGHVIHDVKPNAWLTLSEIIAKSSNIGILKAASHLNKEQLETYTRRFGFGAKTGIDLPYERVGSLRGLRKWDDYTIASVPFGAGYICDTHTDVECHQRYCYQGVCCYNRISLGKLLIRREV